MISKRTANGYQRKSPWGIALGLAFVGLLLCAGDAQAAYLRNFPQTLRQPDGGILNCFATGDEYYSILHDAAGYTIIQDPLSGYYVYAVRTTSGEPGPSGLIAGRVDPAALGLEKGIRHPPDAIRRIRARMSRTQGFASGQSAPTAGTINNIVVFIRFAGETEFTDPISTYNSMFNNTTAGANSMINYFREVSYSALTIGTTFYPTPGATVVSYLDSQPRGYYQPYNSATNTIGYSGGNDGTERRDREHTLLRNAVSAVASQVPAGLNLDGDGDGRVDNICFIVSGSPTGWASLLWPHMWSLYSQWAYINGKRVYDYNLQLRASLLSSGVGVLCHEMFHTLGAPDLYHYSGDGLDPAGPWDIMDDNLNPPQHMGAHMKYLYGRWIGTIPEITAPGTYTLRPLTSSTNNCYKIASPYSTTEYFVVEYRRRTGGFETSLPGEGLIVTRINGNLRWIGNADGPPDEVYVYRPNGTLTVNGTEANAPLSRSSGRTALNDATNPTSFLSSGSAGGLNIYDVGPPGDTISFSVSFTPVTPATMTLDRTSLSFGSAGGTATTSAQTVALGATGSGTLSWTAAAGQSWLAASPSSGTGPASLSISVNPLGLTAGTYAGSITISAAAATNSPRTISVTLKVYPSGGSASPFGYLDTPADGITAVEGSLPVTGWALDDTEVANVKIYRDPAPGEAAGPNGLVYIGDTVFIQDARPDVEQTFSAYPLARRGGWGYMMLTNFLPNGGNGTFRIQAIAADKEGRTSLLGSKTIGCDNAHATLPFGAIDTPTQGGTASGASYINYAWVLAAKPKSIPADGSTITAWVDGAPLGRPSYGYYRSDIAALFPGYANANAAIGYIAFDTTKYANGVHTIVWSATDSAGVNNGFGSRYFTIQNAAAASTAEPKSPLTPLYERGETKASFVKSEDVEIPSLVERGETKASFVKSEDVEIPSLVEREGKADGLSFPPLYKRGDWGDFFAIGRTEQEPIFARRGFDMEKNPEIIRPDPDGEVRIEIRELERIAVFVDPRDAIKSEKKNPPAPPFRKGGDNAAVSNSESPNRSPISGGGRYEAVQDVGGEARPLPIGSTFDSERGLFTWQPGPGFYGTYRFVFVDRLTSEIRTVFVRIKSYK